MTVGRYADGPFWVTGLGVFQTPQSQMSASAYPVGTLVYDLTNGRTFLASVGTGGSHIWILNSPFPDASLEFGGLSLTASATGRVLAPGNGAVQSANITAINFTTLQGSIASGAALLSGISVRRQASGAATLSAGRVYINGVAVGPVVALGAGVNTGSFPAVPEIQIAAGNVVQFQITDSVATTTNLVVLLTMKPPAG